MSKETSLRLAEAFAVILDEVWARPWLRNATTEELLSELQDRLELTIAPRLDFDKATDLLLALRACLKDVLDYRTVDD